LTDLGAIGWARAQLSVALGNDVAPCRDCQVIDLKIDSGVLHLSCIMSARPFTEHEYSILTTHLGTEGRLRDRLIIVLSCASGFRIKELLSLTIGQVCDPATLEVVREVTIARRNMRVGEGCGSAASAAGGCHWVSPFGGRSGITWMNSRSAVRSIPQRHSSRPAGVGGGL